MQSTIYNKYKGFWLRGSRSIPASRRRVDSAEVEGSLAAGLGIPGPALQQQAGWPATIGGG